MMMMMNLVRRDLFKLPSVMVKNSSRNTSTFDGFNNKNNNSNNSAGGITRRKLTTKTGTASEKTVFRDPVRQVFISQSNDVFTNLALEDWLYRHHDFDHKVRFSKGFTQFLSQLRSVTFSYFS